MRNHTPNNKKSTNVKITKAPKTLSPNMRKTLKKLYIETNRKLEELNSNKIIKNIDQPLQEFYESIKKNTEILKQLLEETKKQKCISVKNHRIFEEDFELFSKTKENNLLTYLKKEKENNEKTKKYKEESFQYQKKINEMKTRAHFIFQKYQNEKINYEKLIHEYEEEKTLNENIGKKVDEIYLKIQKKKDDIKSKFKTLENNEKLIKEAKIKNEEINEEKRNTNNNYQNAKGNIRVFCRVRPNLQKEKNLETCLFDFSEKNITIYGPYQKSNIGKKEENRIKENYKFDKIFTPENSQENIFEEISHMVQSSLDGFNVCIFAYGQTGSGKTYTMEGENDNKRGLIPRALERIFDNINHMEKLNWVFKVNLSCLEIYLDQIRDLLKEIKGKNQNNIINKDDNLVKIELKDFNDWVKYYETAKEKRKVAETQCNEKSSRSHCIFQILINCFNKEKNIKREGSLNLIDLAGSERTNKSGVVGDRLKETISINKSLTALKSVIGALVAVDNKNSNFVPYKDSVLTTYLQPYLGGDSKTLMFVNISPVLNSFNESSCSLRFATDVNSCIIDRDKTEFD